jgi:hypothetical protein
MSPWIEGGLRTDCTAQAVMTGLSLLQNVRRGHYELRHRYPRPLRVAAVFAELAQAI